MKIKYTILSKPETVNYKMELKEFKTRSKSPLNIEIGKEKAEIPSLEAGKTSVVNWVMKNNTFSEFWLGMVIHDTGTKAWWSMTINIITFDEAAAPINTWNVGQEHIEVKAELLGGQENC